MRGREKERNITLLFFQSFMHLLSASCMCPDWGWNPHPWCTRRCSNQPSYLARAHILFLMRQRVSCLKHKVFPRTLSLAPLFHTLAFQNDAPQKQRKGHIKFHPLVWTRQYSYAHKLTSLHCEQKPACRAAKPAALGGDPSSRVHGGDWLRGVS